MTSLVKKIDAEIAKNPALKSFVVVLTDDADKTADTLKKMATDCRLKNVPLTVMESIAGPPAYKIAEDADVTVMLWKGTNVKANHAYARGQFTEKDAQVILSDLPKILSD